MINSKCYQINEHIFFLTIVGEKQNKAKNILTPITARVLGTFNEYLTRFSTLSAKAGSEFTLAEERERSHLIGCYKNETASSSFVKGNIFAIQPDVLKVLCPYCMLDRPRTLDHYIPKDEFPEYAMFVRNLIPCCYDCNNKKDELWRNGTLRQFIHYYNDNILNHQFLYSELIFNGSGSIPRIRHFLRKPVAMARRDFQVASSHFENLGLLAAYDDSLNNRLSTEIQLILTYVIAGLSDQVITDLLGSQFLNRSRTYGVNYFEAIIYQTLANHLAQVKLVLI
ncbi:HNH endonuclease [Pedobacter sp. B4-66]|uniref:HNH endonuclease n=1 Tax=Pedobacter sp. B4-66 TaxID=2817280 RepID=UPI001BD9B13F|nr:HNH endonuclease [Pedobacter sp. B4-66]